MKKKTKQNKTKQKNRKGKMAFRSLYKSLKRFFSGEKLHFSCRGKDVELDEESLSVLKAILTPPKKKNH